MLRPTLALALASLAAAPSLAAADRRSELRSDLDDAIAAAKDGRCSEALERTRAIGDADRAFYAAHVPIEPHLAACMRERAAVRRQAAPVAASTRKDDEGLGKGGQIAIAAGAGALAWFGGAYLGASLQCPNLPCGADDEGPTNGLLVGGGVATMLTSTAVVYLAGHDDTHEDSLAATAVGAVGFGLAGTFAGGYLMADDQWLLGAAVIVGSSAVGATVGFHLGRGAKKRGLEIMPTASTSFTGAVLGGSF